MRARALAAALAGGVALAGAGVLAARTGPADGWREVAWPFPRDAWPAGRAFRRGPLDVYVRPKLGFCNCATGVADDDEVDAVSDVDMVGTDFAPAAAGERVVVGGLAGRARAYTLRQSDGTRAPAIGFALSRRCDLVAVASNGARSREAVVALLESAPVQSWLADRLGGGQ